MVQTALKGPLMLAGDDFSDRLMSDRGQLMAKNLVFLQINQELKQQQKKVFNTVPC